MVPRLSLTRTTSRRLRGLAVRRRTRSALASERCAQTATPSMRQRPQDRSSPALLKSAPPGTACRGMGAAPMLAARVLRPRSAVRVCWPNERCVPRSRVRAGCGVPSVSAVGERSCGRGAYAPVRVMLGPAVRAQRRLRRAASSGPGRKTAYARAGRRRDKRWPLQQVAADRLQAASPTPVRRPPASGFAPTPARSKHVTPARNR